MTPQQRMLSATAGQRPDKLPLFAAAANSFICYRYGLSISDYLENTKTCAQATVDFIEEYGLDSCVIASGYILYGCGPEVGVEWQFTNGEFPGFGQGPFQSEADLARFSVPQEPAGYFSNYIDIISRVSSVLGETHHLNANILGPFAAACFLRGIENTLTDSVANKSFFSAYMKICTVLSVYFGRWVQSTGVPFTTLNEIFLTPQMISPAAYHELIAPWDHLAQERLKPREAPNIMGTFMGQPEKHESQIAGRAMYKAFFGVNDSIEDVKDAFKVALPGMPFPLAVSGRMLDSWDADKIIHFLREAIDFLVGQNGVYPSISLISVQAGTTKKADEISYKLKKIREFRDSLSLS